MTIEKKTVVNQIEVTEDGTIQLRFGLLIIEDGKQLSCEWHRTIVPPGGDVAAQISAVNANLAKMNNAPVSLGEVQRIRAVADAVWTPDVLKAYEAKRG